jgi:organic radical activating enzyme
MEAEALDWKNVADEIKQDRQLRNDAITKEISDLLWAYQKKIQGKSLKSLLGPATEPEFNPQLVKEYLEKISKYLASVEKIYFAGGEPLLIQEHYDILDRLIAVGNTNVEITYNTNFTKLQFKHRHIFDLWKQFSNITIGASLDAMGPAAEYIRHGTVWDDIEKNLTQLQKECPHVKFTVTSTVHMLNIESLIQLQKYWHQIPFSFTKLAQPEHLTVQVLPLHHKQRLAKIINLHVNWLQDKEKYPLALAWQSIVKYMFADDCSYKLKEFKRLTLELDQYRKESFQSVFPQYKDLLDV